VSDQTRFHQRLSVQLSAAVALVTGLAFAFTVWFVASQERQTLTHELTLRLLSESRSLSLAASGPLLRHDPELGLHPLILKALEENADLSNLIVLDSRNVIQGHRDILRVGTTFELTQNGVALDIPLQPEEEAWVDLKGSVVLQQPIYHLDRRIGSLLLWASREGIERTVHAAQKRLILIAGSCTLLAILSVLALVNLNLAPLVSLRRGVQRLGDGDLTARVPVHARNELGMFAELVNSMASGLQKAQSKLIQKERLDHELRIARELQHMLLPRDIQSAAGYDIRSHYTPALEVSGDYYDVFPLSRSHLALVAADVSGKGVPGLVVMAMLRTGLRSLASASRKPEETLVLASRLLHGHMGRGMFVTVLYGVLDARTHQFSYVSAGHCPPLHFGSFGARYLPAGGKAVGMFPEQIFMASLKPRTLQLQPGDGLLLYTDGLIEAMNAHGEQLGGDAVRQALEGLAATPQAPVNDALLGLVDTHRNGHTLSDDLTLLSFRRIARPVDRAAAEPVFEETMGGSR